MPLRGGGDYPGSKGLWWTTEPLVPPKILRWQWRARAAKENRKQGGSNRGWCHQGQCSFAFAPGGFFFAGSDSRSLPVRESQRARGFKEPGFEGAGPSREELLPLSFECCLEL